MDELGQSGIAASSVSDREVVMVPELEVGDSIEIRYH